MDNTQILSQVQVIFRDVMDNDTVVLNRDTTAADVEEWDSLSYLRLVFALEKHFKIKIKTNEFSNWKNIGELVDSVATKIAK